MTTVGDERFRKTQAEITNVVPAPAPELDIEKLQRHYQMHQKAVKKYQTKNKAVLKEKQKNYMERLRADEDKYRKHLEKRRIYYSQVLVPRNKKLIEDKHESKETTLVI